MYRIKRFVSALSKALLALFFVAGVTGISFTSHFCHDQLSGTTFYPELGIQEIATCGCADDYEAPAADNSGFQVISSGTCCKNISVSNRITSEFVVSVSHLIAFSISDFDASPDWSATGRPEVAVVVEPASKSPPPPRLAGKQLIYYLCEIRIPADGSC